MYRVNYDSLFIAQTDNSHNFLQHNNYYGGDHVWWNTTPEPSRYHTAHARTLSTSTYS